MRDAANAKARIIHLIEGTPRVVEDRWQLIDTAAQWEAQLQAPLPAGAAADDAGLLLPLELALAQPERLRDQGPTRPVGVWLAPSDDPARVRELLPLLTLVGVAFPSFTDGRGYSTAVLLRTRLGWRGELRALGDVLQDQLFALRRVGFDSFAVRADRDPVAALAGFGAFSDAYQGSVDQPLPAFRRRGTAA
jgi:uncharacterized protein (DUF934 family)